MAPHGPVRPAPRSPLPGTSEMVSFVRAPRALQEPTEVHLTPSQRATVHMAASLLLDYPAEGGLETRLDAVEAELATLPPEVAVLLEEFIAQARRRGERAMAEHYVEVFDRRRRCCLYLPYYTVGDTRHRGAALLAFKQALAAAGYEMAADELPDYLPVVLELSARSGDEVAGTLLSSHREGIEVLRSALADAASPYAGLVEAVSMTLPQIDEATAERVRALVAAGPPTETVGVTNTLPFPTIPVRNPSLSGAPAVPGSTPVADPSPFTSSQESMT